MKNLGYSVDHKHVAAVMETMSEAVWETFAIQKRNTEISLPTEPLYKDLLPAKCITLEYVINVCQYLQQKTQVVIVSLRAGNNTKDDSDNYEDHQKS
jgi:hypothetical protein